MTWKLVLGGALVSLVLLAGPVAPAGALVQAVPGAIVIHRARMPAYVNFYGYYGYGYPVGLWFVFPAPGPYALRYAPSYSYTPNPYALTPGAAAYGTPPYSYSPNAYTYSLYGQAYPWGIYFAPGPYPYVYYFGFR